MLAQRRAATPKPTIALGLCQPSRAPSPPLPKKCFPSILRGPSLLSLLYSCISGMWRAKLFPYLPPFSAHLT